MAPSADLPEPDRTPPRGVPRWLWPPPGAEVTRVVVREERSAGRTAHHVADGAAPTRFHLHALQWLCADYAREEPPDDAVGVIDIVLEVARSVLPGGRVGHAYALNGHALGAPSNRAARGVLWRYAHGVLGRAPESDPAGVPDDL
jgi:hypothetical protein